MEHAHAGKGLGTTKVVAASLLITSLLALSAFAAEPVSPAGPADQDLLRLSARKPLQIDDTYRTFSQLTPVDQKSALKNLGSKYESLGQKCEAKLHYDLAEQLATLTSTNRAEPHFEGAWSISEWTEPKAFGTVSPRFNGASGFLTLRPAGKPNAFAGELHLCARFASGTRRVSEAVTAAYDGKELNLKGEVIEGKRYWYDDSLRLKLQGLELEGTSKEGTGRVKVRLERLL